MRRRLGYGVLRVGPTLLILASVLLIMAYDADLLKHPLQSQIAKYEYWEIATGSYVWSTLIVTYLIAVIISVKSCGRVRRIKLQGHDHRLQGDAAVASILVYLLVPIPTFVAVRALMVRAGLHGFIIFTPLSVILAFVASSMITAVIVVGALLREAWLEGQSMPVTTNARYEFTKEWSEVLTRFGSASDRLRAATYELVRCADPDPSIDRLSRVERTQLLVKEFENALLSPRVEDEFTREQLRALRRQMESEVARSLEMVAKWREELRSLEGEGDDKLPPGTADSLPIPLTVQEKLTIKNARITRIKYI